MIGFLNTGTKEECFGCESCAQACPVSAITMVFDDELFRYPVVDADKCIHCNLCHKVCPYENQPEFFSEDKLVFGGHVKDPKVLSESTSGGAFSAIVQGWCDEDYVIFGAASNGLEVFHTYIEDKSELSKFRQSKYQQSIIGESYKQVRFFLKQGKKVLFSGTPCQIAGLRAYLGIKTEFPLLLTVEVVCEGVPSPHFMTRVDDYIYKRYGARIQKLDYRYKSFKSKQNSVSGKWDFQVMRLILSDDAIIIKDRWFNSFWSVWLKHLMSRPSCYQCPYAQQSRGSDISLGDLWGVHLYCPDLYNRNAGASLVVCNTDKGKDALTKAKSFMDGHELDFTDALKYQSPMRKHIDMNDQRAQFMEDVKTMDYVSLCKKWVRKPSLKLLWQKYVWGNRQKMWVYNKLKRN